MEVWEPPEQVPRDCDPETATSVGQSTVPLATVVGVNPVKLADVSEDVTLQVIAEP